MLRSNRLHKGSSAQAMVEFALIVTVLLMLIFILIESARILWAWNTVQNSAREGIRYAITGQTEGLPCPVDTLSKFTETAPGRDVCGLPDSNRVASIIERSHTALSGLPLDETTTTYEDDNYYNIEVYGVNESSVLQYDFGGLPNETVVVRVTYRVPIITPLISPFLPSIPVVGQVALNNESFGQLTSTGGGTGLPPGIPPIPTAGVTPSPTPSPTSTNTPTAGPSPTATATGTSTSTAVPVVCPVAFEAAPIAGQTSVLVTGEPGATVTIIDIDTGEVLGTTVLLARSGHLCGGFADFIVPLHPSLNKPLVAGHFILVEDEFGNQDIREVLLRPPTATPTQTNTAVPTATASSTPSVTPTHTPGVPYIIVNPKCGSGPNVQFSVSGFNWPDEDISLFWNDSQFQMTVDNTQHNGAFSRLLTINSVLNGTYNVRAISNSVNTTAQFKVPCDTFVPTPVTATPTSTPRPIDLVMISAPRLVSVPPIRSFEPVEFSVVITNTGDVDVNQQFFVDIYLDPSNVYTTHIPLSDSSGYSAVSALAGGDSRVITITAPVGFANQPDPHVVYGMVDSAGPPGVGQIFEPNEQNNVSQPASVAGVIPANTPTPTPTRDPLGVDVIAGIVQSRIIQWVPQYRAQVLLVNSRGIVMGITDTDINGYYQFNDVLPDTYSVYSCIDIDGLSYVGVRTGIVPPNPVANIYMLPGPCAITSGINRPPNINHPGDQTTVENDTVSLQIVATDPDGDTLTYSSIGLPPGLSIDPTTGLISGKVRNNTAGIYYVAVKVSDGVNNSSVLFVWTITPK